MGNCSGGFAPSASRSSSCCTCCCRRRKGKSKDVVIPLFGLDDAGKTTIASALSGGSLEGIQSTNGFNRFSTKRRDTKITLYDLGGSERIRDIWKTYYAEAFGVIYVLDSSNGDRMEENKAMLSQLLAETELINKPVLILLNKQDKTGALDEFQSTDRLDLHELVNAHKTVCRVELCVANRGTGIAMDGALGEGVDWLLERITEDFIRLQDRVDAALEVLKQRRTELRARMVETTARKPDDSALSNGRSASHPARNQVEPMIEPLPPSIESSPPFEIFNAKFPSQLPPISIRSGRPASAHSHRGTRPKRNPQRRLSDLSFKGSTVIPLSALPDRSIGKTPQPDLANNE